MSYVYEIKNYYIVRKHGEYPWPCIFDKKRTIELTPEDVLTKNPDGTFVKHTGVGCFNIKLKSNQVKKVTNNKKIICI